MWTLLIVSCILTTLLSSTSNGSSPLPTSPIETITWLDFPHLDPSSHGIRFTIFTPPSVINHINEQPVILKLSCTKNMESPSELSTFTHHCTSTIQGQYQCIINQTELNPFPLIPTLHYQLELINLINNKSTVIAKTPDVLLGRQRTLELTNVNPLKIEITIPLKIGNPEYFRLMHRSVVPVGNGQRQNQSDSDGNHSDWVQIQEWIPSRNYTTFPMQIQFNLSSTTMLPPQGQLWMIGGTRECSSILELPVVNPGNPRAINTSSIPVNPVVPRVVNITKTPTLSPSVLPTGKPSISPTKPIAPAESRNVLLSPAMSPTSAPSMGTASAASKGGGTSYNKLAS